LFLIRLRLIPVQFVHQETLTVRDQMPNSVSGVQEHGLDSEENKKKKWEG
jgi:maltodextrin utilization protein YvdJ